jgi:hypothetical protein
VDNINTRSLAPPPQGKDGWGGSAAFALLKMLILRSSLLVRCELNVLQSLAVTLPARPEQVHAGDGLDVQASVLSIIFGRCLPISPVVKSDLGGGGRHGPGPGSGHQLLVVPPIERSSLLVPANQTERSKRH